MLYEGTRFHISGLLLGGLAWWWLQDTWKYEYTKIPILTAAAIVVVLSGYGFYRGYDYIHTACSGQQMRTNDCPNYKLSPDWPTRYGNDE